MPRGTLPFGVLPDRTIEDKNRTKYGSSLHNDLILLLKKHRVIRLTNRISEITEEDNYLYIKYLDGKNNVRYKTVFYSGLNPEILEFMNKIRNRIQ